MVHVLVVGGLGYVGSSVLRMAGALGLEARPVSRRGGGGSIAWDDLRDEVTRAAGAVSIVWLLDGARHEESARLAELLAWLPEGAYVGMASTCTVYGDAGGEVCDEDRAVQLVSAHARVKAKCEGLLLEALPDRSAVLRLGALYGVDARGVRDDRIVTWVTSARTSGVVEIPDATHWRGWLHRDQAARAFVAAARSRAAGVFNVATADMTFGQAAGPAAEAFGARVVSAAAGDRFNYRVGTARAAAAGLIAAEAGEGVAACTEAYVRSIQPKGSQ